jgi:hypothetical protein
LELIHNLSIGWEVPRFRASLRSCCLSVCHSTAPATCSAGPTHHRGVLPRRHGHKRHLLEESARQRTHRLWVQLGGSRLGSRSPPSPNPGRTICHGGVARLGSSRALRAFASATYPPRDGFRPSNAQR